MRPFTVIAGPTASGKTALAHRLFDEGLFSSLVAADSRHFYQHLCIGSTKPSLLEIQRYHYQLVDFLDPSKKFSAYQFQEKTKSLLETEEKICVVGGSPFYIESLLHPIAHHEAIPESLILEVEALYKEKGLKFLQNWLKELDPSYYEEVDLANTARLMRSITYCLFFKSPYSQFRKKRGNNEKKALIFVLFIPRKQLHERIHARVKKMLDDGLIEEVIHLKNLGYTLQSPGMNSIGYPEVFAYLEEKHPSLNDLIKEMSLKTRQFAKRQMTWFKRFQRTIFLEYPPYENEKKEEWLVKIPYLKHPYLLNEESFNFRLLLDDDGIEILKELVKKHHEM